MWQGFWVAFVGIPAFIVTLAGMLLIMAVMINGMQLMGIESALQQVVKGLAARRGVRPVQQAARRDALTLVGIT